MKKLSISGHIQFVKQSHLFWLLFESHFKSDGTGGVRGHPSFFRGVKFNFNELQPNFLWVIIGPHRPQKGCETNVSRREIFHFSPLRFKLCTLRVPVRALTPLTYALMVPRRKNFKIVYSLLNDHILMSSKVEI